MKRPTILTLALFLSCSQLAKAQETSTTGDKSAESSDQQWYYGSSNTQPESKPLGRLRSEQRARQRMTRMESMRWYGFSASRPTAAGMPFTSMYAPTWTRPGGRPFAWHTSQRPVVLVSPYYPSRY